ncbi:hypothetical protein Hanom_Chr12g01181791 [Helianthus anomalus]
MLHTLEFQPHMFFFQKISQGGSIKFKTQPNVNFRWIFTSWNMRWSNSRHHSWLQLLFTLLSTIFMDSNIGPKLVNGIQNNPKINFCKPFIFLAF